MKFLLALITFSTLLSSAQAQYTCNDRTYLRSVLNQLEASCGGGNTSVSLCTAKGYKGSTLESAVAACKNSGWSQSTCNQDVTCTGGFLLCTAKGYKGSSLESAVAACKNSGWSESTCNQDVTCVRN